MTQPRIQSPDLDAVDTAFGSDIDYAQLMKVYGPGMVGAGRYSPPEVVSTTKETVCGAPEPKKISTSYIERQNLTVRMGNRRFTRLANALGKKDRESRPQRRTALYALQLLPDSPDASRHASNAGQTH